MPHSTVEAIAPERDRVNNLVLNRADCFKNIITAVVGKAITTIKRFVTAIHNRCPLVVYVDAMGRTCAQFVKRDAFSGYAITFNNNIATVTNKETGVVYQVNLSIRQHYCTCPAFKYAPLPKQPCKHIKMVAELQGNLEQLVAQAELDQHIAKQASAIAPEYVEINEQDLPKGCSLQRTEDWLSREFYLSITAIKRVRGVPTVQSISAGRLIDGNKCILAYTPRSGIERRFASQLDAIQYLVKAAGYTLKDIAAALDHRFPSDCIEF